jgi:hypothetical protein
VTLPLTATTIAIRRPTEAATDPTDPPTVTPVAAGVPAVIASPAGTDFVAGGSRELVDAALLVDPDVDVQREDLIDDELTGATWRVTWLRERTGLGLGHLRGGLQRVTGAAGA